MLAKLADTVWGVAAGTASHIIVSVSRERLQLNIIYYADDGAAAGTTKMYLPCVRAVLPKKNTSTNRGVHMISGRPWLPNRFQQ